MTIYPNRVLLFQVVSMQTLYKIQWAVLSTLSVVSTLFYGVFLYKVTRKIKCKDRYQEEVVILTGGLVSSVLLCAISIDPVPVEGIYSPEIIESLSNAVVVCILLTTFYATFVKFDKMYKEMSFPNSVRHYNVVHTISLLLIITLSSSIFFTHYFFQHRASKILFLASLISLETAFCIVCLLTYRSLKSTIERTHASSFIPVKDFKKKLQYLYVFLLLFVIYQGYFIYIVVTDHTTCVPDKTEYKLYQSVVITIIQLLVIYAFYIYAFITHRSKKYNDIEIHDNFIEWGVNQRASDGRFARPVVSFELSNEWASRNATN